MQTENRIKEITEELRALYHNDNDAPRLIAEMLTEFPNPRGPEDCRGDATTHSLG